MPLLSEQLKALVDAQEAAIILGVSKDYVRRITGMGKLRVVSRVGGRPLYDALEVQKYKRFHPQLECCTFISSTFSGFLTERRISCPDTCAWNTETSPEPTQDTPASA